MTLNKQESISERTFTDLLVKALKNHVVAKRDYGAELICHYYDTEFQIIKGEPIGIDHIFAIIVYTDMSDFCRVYRESYRQMKSDKDENAVRARHKDFYHFARALFEAVEFFGQSMESTLAVHHGLSVKLLFEQFTAYFHQPISTTTAYSVGTTFLFAFHSVYDHLGLLRSKRTNSAAHRAEKSESS